ncbi:ABC transporter permease [Bacillus pinisoli]|uniref:ABC transporter permease n=1 Tax=Bacillus pinisoli TaxID=2901866 RepID=UPI001FF3F4B4|nr:ABC transporter permease [Bacillus pinisoli]
MKFVFEVVKEQILNLSLIFRLASYEIKSSYQMHYLGVIWQFLNPLLLVTVYWLVFGLGLRGDRAVEGDSYFIWLIVGLIPFLFISPSITQGSNSVYAKVNLVSKMKFPVSILPSITIVSNLFNFFIMLIAVIIVLYFNNVFAGFYLLQLPYFLFATVFFLFAITLLCSTISIIARDFQLLLQSIMRIMLYLTPILWDPSNLPTLEKILKLNPMYYLVEGYRYMLLGESWFFLDWRYTFYFWICNFVILFIGASLHVHFRKKFVDYL